MIQFVPTTDPVKISLINLKNESNQERQITLTYYVRPVVGVSDQTTAVHINANQDEAGALLIRNPYNEVFPGEILLIDASIPER